MFQQHFVGFSFSKTRTGSADFLTLQGGNKAEKKGGLLCDNVLEISFTQSMMGQVFSDYNLTMLVGENNASHTKVQ